MLAGGVAALGAVLVLLVIKAPRNTVQPQISKS
jgi:hypothetical protein